MITTFKEDMASWITQWVSVYNEKMKAIPCPFAKQALMKDEIEWDFAENFLDLIIKLTDFELKKEVAIIGFHRDLVDFNILEKFVEDINIDMMKRDLVALEDHPDSSEIVFGESMNHGTWGFIAVQSLSKLNRASEILARSGYYKDWPQEYYNDVVAWRFEKK
ncbi:hypothetical protein UFOVP247_203 [uncultured Caudovirales phage]|uniref:Uncharacterized protein n=1 Tax=uncultured Caudovirales phage TaxID=2100421 RepID=A0A6J7WU05_9CAUD|nr:hypothetical protein UFOVP247_203 [uncultured Caudovirales phage]